MTTAPGMSGASIEALRTQIENELREQSRRHRLRVALTLAAIALVASLVLNVLVIAAPGMVGLASADDLEAARDEIAATTAAADARLEEAATQTRVAARRAAEATRAVPVICSTLEEIGGWSFLSGEAPEVTCPPAER